MTTPDAHSSTHRFVPDPEQLRADISRRTFLYGAAALTAGAAVVSKALADTPPTTQPATTRSATTQPGRLVDMSTVVIVHHPKAVLADGRRDAKVLAQMLDAGILALSGQKKLTDAWQTYFTKDDLVAVKYNELGGPMIRTPESLVDIVQQRLIKLSGVQEDKVVAYGRRVRGKYAGDSKEYDIRTTGITTRLDKLLTDHATALLNMPVLKTHSRVGISIAMKNHLGSNNNPGAFHPWPKLRRNVPELNSLPPIKDKTRLIVCDATRPQYDFGPGDKPQFRWNHNCMMFATDPVAMDKTGLDILEGARKKHFDKDADWTLPMGRDMVSFAQRIGLGRADRKKINIVEIDLAQTDPDSHTHVPNA